ncbi:hypothetical protein [Dongia sp.]|uniref:hypothetical protein n=1 Tax=Dongia sp. TaxID=1977262 RepID=UPI0035B24996
MSEELGPESIEDPVDFFATLGYLHGAAIDALTVQVLDQVATIFVDDIYAALEGQADYPGARPCALSFFGVSNFSLDVDISDGARIAALRAIESAKGVTLYSLEIDLNIGGASRGKSLALGFSALEVEDAEIDAD